MKKNPPPGDLQPTGRLPVGKKNPPPKDLQPTASVKKKWGGEDLNPVYFSAMNVNQKKGFKNVFFLLRNKFVFFLLLDFQEE